MTKPGLSLPALRSQLSCFHAKQQHDHSRKPNVTEALLSHSKSFFFYENKSQSSAVKGENVDVVSGQGERVTEGRHLHRFRHRCRCTGTFRKTAVISEGKETLFPSSTSVSNFCFAPVVVVFFPNLCPLFVPLSVDMTLAPRGGKKSKLPSRGGVQLRSALPPAKINGRERWPPRIIMAPKQTASRDKSGVARVRVSADLQTPPAAPAGNRDG